MCETASVSGRVAELDTDEITADHSILSKTRSRFGREVYEQVWTVSLSKSAVVEPTSPLCWR
jgi:hypothetical protein